MAVTEIQATWRATCDCCGEIETMKSSGRPAHWINLNILRDAYDFQGSACADASVKLLLCVPCSRDIVKAINASVDDIRSARKALGGPNAQH